MEFAQIHIRPQITQEIMAHFIELHIKHNGNPIYINTDAIAFVENEDGRVYVNFLNQRILSNGGSNVFLTFQVIGNEKRLLSLIHL